MGLEIKDLNKLIRAHVHFKAQVADIDEEYKEKLKPLKDKLKRIESKLATVIHRDSKEGLPRVSLPDSSFTAYARYEDKYKMQDRDVLINEYILENVPDQYKGDVKDRLDIFSNTLTKEPCIEYRVETGAEENGTRLVGGALPPGTGMYTDKQVRIVKGTK